MEDDENLFAYQPGPPSARLTAHGTLYKDERESRLTSSDGTVLTVRHDERRIEILNPVVKRVEISNLLAIAGHRVVRVFDTTSHFFEFEGGGVFAYVCDAQGKILEITTAGGMRVYVGHDGVYVVSKRPDGGQSSAAGRPP